MSAQGGQNDDVAELADEYGIDIGPPPSPAIAEAQRAIAAADDAKGRVDLRQLPLVTIDGADAKDFDDAVHCRREGGVFQLTVAVADAASYVVAGSALDDDARARATSVYFPGRVLPMLPPELSEDRCSLRPKEERRALACEMAIDGAGKVVKFRFRECLIRSAARLTYPEAEEMLARPPGKDAVEASLADLAALARILLERRERDGAFVLATPPAEAALDEDAAPAVPERLFAEKLIEECMLAANRCAAGFLRTRGQQFLYRVHGRPQEEKAARLRDVLAGAGLKCGARDPARLVIEAAAAISGIEDAQLRRVLVQNLLQALGRASYTPDNEGHFGLGFDEYAHFTSPIRRYPDLTVHRAIKEALRQERRPAASAKRLAELRELGAHCSMKEMHAERAVLDYIARQLGRRLRSQLGMRAEGVVSGMSKGGMFVVFGGQHEGMLRFADMDDYYVLNQHRTRARGRRSGRAFAVGMPVPVQVAAVDEATGRCRLALAD
ncbi:MAG: VacB/RNase II family 3'-5' exoribonuclease [Betaproteobacteria bacterium AqS2]|uniref:exoribonuclease II n=1 Tax=Candidatus Amphirhobacter heronislandensis TaxID=1732024 RepID=A0A930UDG7_9GAMM|nr:VacB/RNase II family 3'-5' exoribonuclease [Betaproteobacteria bacterium AqS2]